VGAVIHRTTESRQARIAVHLGLSAIGLVALTLPFWVWPIDLWIEGAAWQGPAKGWSLGERQPWKALYHLGTLPALAFALAALAVAFAGFRVEAWAKWNKAAIYLILCMAAGPGFLVNLGFKDHWGRPRPREVTTFGGEHPPEKVWIRDATSPGKSFPCGHCTMGFYFFAPGLLLARLGRRRDAALVFGLAIISGLLLGIARMLQGGHFPSDVLWAAGFCWLVSLGLFYALSLDKSLTWEVRLPDWVRRGPQQLVTVGLSLA
jgi:membrane-associated PAP2 superfamily phosphatase